MQAKLKKLVIPVCYALMVIPLVSIIAKMPGHGHLWLDFTFVLYPCLFGFGLDACIPKEKSLGLHFLLSLLVGAIYMLSLRCSLGFGMALTAGAAALVMMLGTDMACRRGLERAIPTYLIALSIAAYVAAYLFYLGTGNYFPVDGVTPIQPILPFGVIWICIAIFLFNLRFVNRMAATRSHPKAPKKVIVANMISSAFFSAVILLFAGFDWLRRTISAGASAAWHAITSLLMKLSDLGVNVEGTPNTVVEEETQQLPGAEAVVRPEWWVTIVRYAMYAILSLALLAALVFLGLQLRRLWRWFFKWITRRLADLQNETNNDYVDELEDLRQENRNQTFARRRTQREHQKRLEDMPDNRAKVRYLYAQWLRLLKKQKSLDISLTPNELQKLRAPDLERFAQHYNLARFSSHAIADQAVSESSDALKSQNSRSSYGF